MQRNQHRSAFVMLAPATALLGVFIILPMLLTIGLSFTRWSTQTGFETAAFIGIQNFIDIFANTSVGRDFKAALVNTGVYTLASVVVILPLSVLLGLLVHRRSPGGVFLRTVLFSTYMVPMIAVALVFSSSTRPPKEPLNQILGWVGIGPQTWLSAPQTRSARSSSSTSGRWAISPCWPSPASPRSGSCTKRRGRRRQSGATLLHNHAAAARNTLLFSAVIAVINAVQVFEPVAHHQGGPVRATNVLTYHIRRVGINGRRAASARPWR